MPHYISFPTSKSDNILVEVEGVGRDVQPGQSIKAGLLEDIKSAFTAAEVTLQTALSKVIQANVDAIQLAVKDLSCPPSEMEMTFSLKAKGETGGYFAVGKVGGEANYTVRLVWKTQTAQA